MKVPVKPSGEGPFIPYPLKYCCSGRKRKKSGQMEILPSFSPPIGPRLKLASHPAVQYSSIKHPSNIIHATENQAWIMYVRNNPRRTNKIVFSSPVMTSSMIVHAYDCGPPFSEDFSSLSPRPAHSFKKFLLQILNEVFCCLSFNIQRCCLRFLKFMMIMKCWANRIITIDRPLPTTSEER